MWHRFGAARCPAPTLPLEGWYQLIFKTVLCYHRVDRYQKVFKSEPPGTGPGNMKHETFDRELAWSYEIDDHSRQHGWTVTAIQKYHSVNDITYVSHRRLSGINCLQFVTQNLPILLTCHRSYFNLLFGARFPDFAHRQTFNLVWLRDWATLHLYRILSFYHRERW